MPLTPKAERFILHWGEMGTRWGINRTVAQIHALLYLSPDPLTAPEISKILNIAKSNTSTSLRELRGWGVVSLAHSFDDRRNRYETTKDVWEMFQWIIDERKKRECDPTLELLRELTAKSPEEQLSGRTDLESYVDERLTEMLGFYEAVTSWYDQIRKMPNQILIQFIRMGSKIRNLLERNR